MPSSVLINNADYLLTMDKKRRVLRNTSVYIEDCEIKEIGSKRKRADKVIDATGKIVLPGFINCHHHMFQSLFRNVPYQQNQRIDKWITAMMAMTEELTPEASYYAALTNMAELLLSGCTTTIDFFYIFPRDKKGRFEATIRAAKAISMRFHSFRAFRGNLILSCGEEVIKKFHENKPFPMIQIGLGLCTPFSNTKKDFIKLAKLARKYKVALQVHVAESEFENDYCQKNFGKRPIAYLQSIDWKGPDVSYVHCIYLNHKEIEVLSKSKTGVVHCPISNARGEGIAPITEMLEKGVNVGIGVDGSASNDSSNILEEMRWARTLQGVREGLTYFKPSQVLEIGTIGGAKVLNRDDIGALEPGKAADIAIFDTRDKIGHAGAVCDPVGSLIASQAISAEHVIVNGKIIVERGRLKTIDLQEIIDSQNRFAQEAVNLAEKKTGRPLSKVQWIKAIPN